MSTILIILVIIINVVQSSHININDNNENKNEQFLKHFQRNKETSPVLNELLKKGSIVTVPSSHLVQTIAPPMSETRQEMSNSDPSMFVTPFGLLKRHGRVRNNVKKPFIKLNERHSTVVSGGYLKEASIPGDVFYFFGTLLELEYASCTDGDLEDDLSNEQENLLVSAKGYTLGECIPYESPAGLSYILTATENIFLETLILHEITFEYPNCTGVNVSTNINYPGPDTCVGDSKLFVTTSSTLHTLFPLLDEQLFVLPISEECHVRENLLYFELHNTSYNHFNSDMCWTYDYYTLSIQEGSVYDPVLETTIVTQEFEPFDDKKCRRTPVLIEGWVLDRCEPLTEHTGMKAVWTSVGVKDGTFYIGVQGYDTYDCDRNQSMTGVTVLNMKRPHTCYHNVPVPWMIHENVDASWADYGFDSHSEFYGGQICNSEHLFMWKTAETECSIDTKTDYSQCLTYNHYAEDDMDDVYNDDFAVELKSQEIFCHVSEETDDICFHIDTTIDYKGSKYTYEDFLNGHVPECTVPHTPNSVGVVVSTTCGKTLRLTDTHLVATSKGFRMAYSLKPGDVLFGDYNGTELCTVEKVRKESSVQQYFGLNCVHSEVLASGLRVSTFGDFHTLPSWYMSYIGGMVGSSYASSFGKVVAEWYYGNQ